MLAEPVKTSQVLQLVVEGAGPLGLAELAAAVAAASQAYPGARLERDDRMWVDAGRPPTVQLVNGPCAGQGICDLPELSQQISVTRGPTCEVLLVAGIPGAVGNPGAVVFRASHAVMDARGVQMWALDVFRVLRGQEVEGATDPVGRAEAFAHITDVVRGGKPSVLPGWLLGPPRKAKPLRMMWRRRTVDGYHPALVAKVATAIMHANGWEASRFMVGVDLRRHLPGLRSTAFLSWGLFLDVRAGQTWEENHQRLLRELTGKQELGSLLPAGFVKIPLRLVSLILRSPGFSKQFTRHSTAQLSHLARLDMMAFCAPSFEARTVYNLPILTHLAVPELIMIEAGGRTEFTLAWHDGPGMAARADAVLDYIEEELSPKSNRCWNRNEARSPMPAETVVALFREQVRKAPDAVALRWADGEMSFAELDQRSEVVAAALLRAGVGSCDVVGLLADRSAAAITGMWGVLKAGAAYLPLDCHHPDARIAALLADAQVGVCLVEQVHARRDYAPPGCSALVLDDLDYSGSQQQVAASADLGDLAYVIYTSGSTGAPKGVEISHRSLANYVGWAHDKFGVDSSTSFALFTSLAFDLPHTAVFLSVLSGAALVLVPDEPNHLSLKYLVEASGANALKLTPSHVDLIDRLGLRPSGFKVLVVGGEPLRPAVAARAQELFGAQCRIFNHYGPTEMTVGCLVHAYDPEQDGAGQTVPIGRPMANTSMVLLDSERRFVAPGESGEMYLGGVQVARGYRGRPDLDREKFVRLADGQRVYRSGDLARALPSGEVEFLGRVDDQLKIMGHRIEPAEIAQALEGYPGVARAVVVARSRPGQSVKGLYAYIVAEVAAGGELSVADVESFLAERLPRHMVPGKMMIIDEVPQTVNGKLDFRALPDPFTEGVVAVAAVTPRDEVGDAVAAIWARVLQLGIERIDGSADFNQLGGNSLLMLEMLAGVWRELLVEVAESAFTALVAATIREPTLERVSELASRIRAENPGHVDLTKTV